MSIANYLQSLMNLKVQLSTTLEQKGVEVLETDKFGDLVQKVNDVTSTQQAIDKVLYSFGVLSDIHLKDTNYGLDSSDSLSDYQKALTYYNDNNVDFIAIAGDIVANNRPVDDSELVESQLEWLGELNLFKQYNSTYFNGKEVHACTGNHDATPNGHYGIDEGMDKIIASYGDGTKTAEQVWEEVIGNPINYVIEKNGDVFIFFSMYYWYYVNFCRVEDITWLETQLELYSDRRVFLFFHLPLPGTFDLSQNGLGILEPGQICRANEMQELIMSYNNVIWFSGHTHYDLSFEETYDNPNTYQTVDSMTMIHCASCAYTRIPDGEEYLNIMEGSQGYIVDVYEKKVVIKGIDFTIGTNGGFIANANYVINS